MTDRPKPLPYQKEAIRGIVRFGGRALVAHEMGLGKTVTSLGYLSTRPELTPAVVVCPASVKYSWEWEATRFGIRADIAEGRRPPRRRMAGSSKLIIINYDILKDWVDWLRALNPQAIIFDECHLLGHRDSGRTRAAVALSQGVGSVIALSGTPLTNRPAELWPTLNILRPDVFDSFWKFGCEHCEPKLNRGRWEYKGAANLDALHRNLKRTVMLRQRKIDVLDQLPDKSRRIVPVELSDKKEYRRASFDFLGWLKDKHADRVFAAKRAEKVVKVGYLLRLVARLKCRAVARWANQFLKETDEKLVLFAVHKKMIDVLRRRIDVKSVVVDGSITGRKRKAAVDQFRIDKRTRLFVGNIKAAGTGVDGLQNACSTMAFAELWWKPGDIRQAEGRLDRIGQSNHVAINYLVTVDTIEQKLCEILQRKQGVIGATLDGDDADADDLNVFDELLATMEREE